MLLCSALNLEAISVMMKKNSNLGFIIIKKSVNAIFLHYNKIFLSFSLSRFRHDGLRHLKIVLFLLFIALGMLATLIDGCTEIHFFPWMKNLF